MNKSLFTILTLLVSSTSSILAQVTLVPKSDPITVKLTGTAQIIPIEYDFFNGTGSNVTAQEIVITIENSAPNSVNRLVPAELNKISVLNNTQNLTVNNGQTAKLANPVSLVIGPAINIDNEKTISVKFISGMTVLGSIDVVIQPKDKVLVLKDYLDNQKLDYVTKVVSDGNILTLSGFKSVPIVNANGKNTTEDVFVTRKVELTRRKGLRVTERSYFLNGFHWKSVPISITSVPFKIRPTTTMNGRQFSGTASGGITNLGLNVDLAKIQTDKYFATGKKVTHKWSIGGWVAPSIEELDSIATFGALGKAAEKLEKSKQLYISAGLTISYTYNDISFIFVPLAGDFGTTTLGKTWIYDKKYWWGFGIAISPKIFGAIFNAK